MFSSLQNDINFIKSRWPTLDEEPVKNFLKMTSLSKVNSFTMAHSVERLKYSLNEYPAIYNEVQLLEQQINHLKEECIQEEINDFYISLKKGQLLEKQIYHRNLHPFGGKDFFTLKWSVEKAQKIVKEENVLKEDFPISKMNVDESELDTKHIKNAIHNKRPALMVSYEPFKDGPYYNFLIDGNHRVIANKNLRNREVYMVYKLSGIQSLKALRHDFYRCYHLMHLLISLFWNARILENGEIERSFEHYLEFRNELIRGKT